MVDWSDPLDPLNPLHSYFWGDWVCPNCAEDGEAADLSRSNQCPNCGTEVEPIP